MASQLTRPTARFFCLRRSISLVVLVLSSIVWTASASAQTEAPNSDEASMPVANRDAPIRPLYGDGDITRRLSLAEALALSVQKNLNVEVARYEPLIAEQRLLSAWGSYDPVLSANIGRVKTEAPNTFSLDSATKSQTLQTNGGTALTALLPYVGATVGVDLETGVTQQNSTIQSFSRQYDSAVFLTATIPLLRGLVWNEPWTQVKLGKLSYAGSVDGFSLALMDVTEGTINAYWNLVAAQEQFRVERKSLETAQALLGQSQTQYEVGVVSRVEVVEAEAGVATREFNLIVARNSFENAEDILIDAVFGAELAAVTAFRVAAVDDPEDYEFREVDVARSVELAFRKLPELRIADLSIQEREVELKFAKNSRLPQFDLTARYGFVNRSGQDNIRACSPFFGPPGPREMDCLAARNTTGYTNSYNNFFEDEGAENYDFRGTFSIPIPNTTGRRNVTRSELELRRARTQRARTKLDVIVAVRSAARGILASAQGIEAAERRRLAAEEQLRAERIRLEHGESTPFEVLQRESDLVDAESQKITALQAYRTAEARLERAQGTILDTYRIQLDDVRSPGMR
jgi:outer membrane protein TolC